MAKIKEEIKVDSRFPRNLYKSPGKIKFSATKTYDTILVTDTEEMEEALKNGFIDGYADALNGQAKKDKKAKKIDLDDGF